MKYKILGYSLICFIIFLISIWLWPKDEIDSKLFVDTNIDSIQIDKSQKDFTIISRNDIRIVSTQLKKVKKLTHIKCERCSTGFYDLNVYIKNQSEPYFLRISFTEYDGVVLRAGDSQYYGESLDSLIKTLRDL